MFYSLIFINLLICSTMFLFMSHPLAMGLMLLIQTLLVCLMSGILTKTFWFSYVLFLIFLGGLLVLFIYVTSLASNEMFNFSMKIIGFSSFIFILFFIQFTLDYTFLMNYFMNYDISPLLNFLNMTKENSLILNNLYNFPINLITIMLMIYLFLTLIAVVKITNIFEGPLRPKNI